LTNSDLAGSKIGVIGWCMGGSYSLQTAVSNPGIDAAVIAYGRLVTDAETLTKINAPILGIFGEADRGIPVKDVKEFEEALSSRDVETKIIIYPDAGHAFMNENNVKGYKKELTENAWDEIYTFLDKHLKD
jgi:carboxymethylenebutenolidase